jgi:hypothetical protein
MSARNLPQEEIARRNTNRMEALQKRVTGIPVKTLALEYGVHYNTIRDWINREIRSGSDLGKQLCTTCDANVRSRAHYEQKFGVPKGAAVHPFPGTETPEPVLQPELQVEVRTPDALIQRYKEQHAKNDVEALKSIVLELLIENYRMRHGKD